MFLAGLASLNAVLAACGSAQRQPVTAEPSAPPAAAERAARAEGDAGVGGAPGSPASLPVADLVIGVGGSVVASGVTRVPRESPASTPAPSLLPPLRPDGAGWVCFSWIDHYVWGQDCYRTAGACAKALRLNPRGAPSPCDPRDSAYCLRTRDASGEETRCFGELGHCQDHQDYLHLRGAAFSACTRFE